MPAAPPPLPAESETQETADPEAFSETSSSGGSKPPPIKSKRASSIDDDDDDDEPPQKKGRKYDDEEDEDSDEIDVRRRGSRGGGRPVNGMAMTSMITGVAAVAVGVPGCLFCCCGLFTGIAAVAGTVAVILGYMSKDSPGSESYSKTGIICGSVAIVQALIGIIYFILSITLRFGMLGMHNF
jgi:hypothetical protein